MTKEPNKAIKKDPESIQPAQSPGGDYDPLDRIVHDVQNVQSFIAHLDEYPSDLNYLDTHLSKILSVRKAILSKIDQLSEPPYDYSPYHLELLKKENELIFCYLEGAVGAMKQPNLEELKKFTNECGKAISKFDGTLTPE